MTNLTTPTPTLTDSAKGKRIAGTTDSRSIIKNVLLTTDTPLAALAVERTDCETPRSKTTKAQMAQRQKRGVKAGAPSVIARSMKQAMPLDLAHPSYAHLFTPLLRDEGGKQ